MASDCLLSYSYPASGTAYSNVSPVDRQVDCRVTASRKRQSEVDLDSRDCNDLQEIVWRDVDQMTKVSKKEIQILEERMRRERMKRLCTQLESLLPAAPAKLDRCGLIEEAINYIRKLEDDLHQLKRKRDRLLAIFQSEEKIDKNKDLKVSVEIHEREAIIIITSQRRPRYMWRILEEFAKHDVDVETSQLFTGEYFVLVHFHVKFRENISHDPTQIQSFLECKLQLTY